MAESQYSDPVRALAAREEKDLVLRTQAGNHAAFQRLMELHVRSVRAFVALRTPGGANHLVEEITQEAFVVAYEKIGEFEAGTAFGAWVRTIAWYALRREVQRWGAEHRKRNKLALHETTLFDEQSRSLQDDRVDYLQQCLKKVAGAGRRLLHLKYFQGNTTAEIAEEMGKSGDWVRTNLYRLRNQLRACIQQSLRTQEGKE